MMVSQPRTLITILLAILALSAAAAPPDSDEAALQGNWRAIEIDRDGKPAADAELRDEPTFWTFNGGSLVQIHGSKPAERFSFRLREGAMPKEIDLGPADGPEQGKWIAAIYDVTGDTLQVALAQKPDEPRPKELKAAKGVIYLKFLRQ